MSSSWGWIGIGIGIIAGLVVACSKAEADAQRTQEELDRRRREWEREQQKQKEDLEQLQLQQSLEAKQKSIALELSNLQNSLKNFEAEEQLRTQVIYELSAQIKKSFGEKAEYKEKLSQIETPKIYIQDKVSEAFLPKNNNEYFCKYLELLEQIRDLANHCQRLINQRDDFRERLESTQNIISDIKEKIRKKEVEKNNLNISTYSLPSMIGTI